MSRTLLLPLLCAGLAAGGSVTPALALDEPPSLRIVTEGHPKTASYRKNIALALHACQVSQGLPRSDAGLPSEAELSAFRMEVRERLLDGPLAALYITASEVMPDPGKGCKLRVARNYRVEIDRTCSWYLSGGASAFDVGGPGVAEPLTEERSRPSNCQSKPETRPGVAAALAKAPRHSAPLGQSCIWDSDVDALLGGQPASSSKTGACQWAEMPVYPYTDYRGQPRPVGLLLALDDGTRAGTALSAALGAVAASFKNELTVFERGRPIAKDRFSRAGAEAFLTRPRWTELGDAK